MKTRASVTVLHGVQGPGFGTYQIPIGDWSADELGRAVAALYTHGYGNMAIADAALMVSATFADDASDHERDERLMAIEEIGREAVGQG